MKSIVLAAAVLLAGCATPQAPQEFHFDESLTCIAEGSAERPDDGYALLRVARVTCIA